MDDIVERSATECGNEFTRGGHEGISTEALATNYNQVNNNFKPLFYPCIFSSQSF